MHGVSALVAVFVCAGVRVAQQDISQTEVTQQSKDLDYAKLDSDNILYNLMQNNIMMKEGTEMIKR
jgi:hypothetical protein